jgi:hypothetical protein
VRQKRLQARGVHVQCAAREDVMLGVFRHLGAARAFEAARLPHRNGEHRAGALGLRPQLDGLDLLQRIALGDPAVREVVVDLSQLLSHGI